MNIDKDRPATVQITIGEIIYDLENIIDKIEDNHTRIKAKVAFKRLLRCIDEQRSEIEEDLIYLAGSDT